MTTVHTLASGSSGNALVCSCGGTHLLVDAGISCRRITASLRELGLAPADLDAIFITHTHTDHISGLQTLVKHCAVPLYGSGPTLRGLCYRLAGIEDRCREVRSGEAVDFDGCAVTAFPTSHDAPGACGYRVDTGDGSVGILTDTGYVTDEATEILPGVDLAVLEANHDVETLRSGPYPYYLKERILGDQGHLSNEVSARFAVTLAEAGASSIVLAHLSRENNTPAMARNAVETALSAAGLAPELSVAPRDSLGPTHIVSRRAVCRK
ncbi:MBL fold metallo-hydrolase [Dysosmobacter sp.]|uniref:MBL fold metallo-hydrolase n=1 Tax=Dysosmobacter sp. TaxID=2591382 RepID=UPI002A87360B|nr:MBL fold metallo-hydrolase [Dysosmobacter sp.]MDY3984821.1 MBL fold metallo-hydrolase [Dysosmobacter sp.]